MQFRINAVFIITLLKADVNMTSDAADGISFEGCSTQELISRYSSTYDFENSSAVIPSNSRNYKARIFKNSSQPKCTADTKTCTRNFCSKNMLINFVLIIFILLVIIISVLVVEVFHIFDKYSMSPTTGVPLHAAEANIKPTLVPARSNVTHSTQSIHTGNTPTETRSISRRKFRKTVTERHKYTTSVKICEEWKCMNSNCVNYDDVCNNIDNCGDNTDEYFCDCGDSFFCDDGYCLNKMWVCDGTKHCLEGEDERGCGT